MNQYFKNVLIFFSLIGLMAIAAWRNWKSEDRTRKKQQAIDALYQEYNDSFYKSPALPILINHYKYGVSVVLGSTVIPIDSNELNCWKQEEAKWREFYFQQERKINAIK